MKRNDAHRESGFSLIELSIVLMIAGIIFAGFISFYEMRIRSQRQQATQENMAAVQIAIHDFLSQHSRLPCPARTDLPPQSADYGIEQPCTETSPPPEGIITTYTPDNEKVSIGAVPVRTLGIADSFAQDGWKGRMSYAVTTELAKEGRPSGMNISMQGVIRILGAEKTDILVPPALYTLISHGPSGTGALGASGRRLACVAEDVLEHENCNDDGIFLVSVRSDAPNEFFYDDIVLHDRNISYNKDTVLARTVESLIACQNRSSFYRPTDPSADEEGCIQASISTGKCQSGYVMSGVDSRGQIQCAPKMESGLCQNGEVLLGYDQNGGLICDGVVKKMLACGQQGLLFVGEGSPGANAAGCRAAALPSSP
ncbi:MAG: type II secretion system protein [Alphaproteobacteria bacterium]|nr:type II secretion system protein [Alphaproteobacteria bacterium]